MSPNPIKIVLAYLEQESSLSTDINPEEVSKEDPTKQTQAVEQLLKEVVSKRLPQWKDKIFEVGGFVRDQLLGKNPKDIDLVVDDPDLKMESAKEFSMQLAKAIGISSEGNPHPLKETYGIWGVALLNPKDASGKRPPFIYNGVDISGYVIELTPPRKEGPYDEAKREPQYVEYTNRSDDATRRDLTVNALYKGLIDNQIEDHVGGLEDLKNKILKPPEHPGGIAAVYTDDPLRIWRTIRFMGKLPEFKVDPKTEEVIKNFLSSPEGRNLMKTKLSAERIRDEFEAIITNKDANKAIEGLEKIKELGLIKYIAPDLEKTLDLYHDTVFHKGESVWQHTMEVFSKTPPTLKARLGALFHDIGKIVTKSEKVDSEGRNRVQFLNHEDKSAVMVDKILRELKFPGDVISSVKNIVHSHMGFMNHENQGKDTQLKRIRIFIEKLFGDIDDAVALIKADAQGPEEEKRVEQLIQRIKQQKEEDIKKGLLVDKGSGHRYDSPITGEDLVFELSTLKGEAIGAVKNRLKELSMEGRFDNVDDKKRMDMAKQEIAKILKDQKYLESIISKYISSRKNPEFYKVRS